jgi:hypothetical protein
VELADDVGGQGVALGAGAQAGGHLQQRSEGLVQGVAAGCVALGADGFDLGLGEGVLGPQGAAGGLVRGRAGVFGGAVQREGAVVARHLDGVVAADGHPGASAREPVFFPGGVDPGVPPLAVLADPDAAVDPRLGVGHRPGVVVTAHASVPLPVRSWAAPCGSLQGSGLAGDRHG